MAAAQETPGPGHNLPPLDEQLTEETRDLFARRDELVSAVGRAPAIIPDDDWEAKITDVVRMIQVCTRTAETTRVARKDPFLSAERLIDAFFRKVTDPLADAKRDLERRLTTYKQAKEAARRRQLEEEAAARRAEEERLRRAAEEEAAKAQTDADLSTAIDTETAARQADANAIAAQKAAEVKPAELTRARGDLGGVSSLQTYWDFTDLDRETIDLQKLRPYLAVADIEKAVRLYIRAGGRDLIGCRIFENTRTRVV